MKKNNLLFWAFALFISSVTFSSCGIFTKEEPVPSYIYIEKIKLSIADQKKFGSETEAFTDAWVFQNGNLIGAFELPAHFPIIPADKNSISIRAGIKKNGIDASRDIYPFLTTYEYPGEPNFQPLETDTMYPEVTFVEGPNYIWIENFDDSFITLDTAKGFPTPVTRTFDSNEVREGVSSGKVVVPTNERFFGLSRTAYTIPYTAPTAYFELDYSTTLTLEIGFYVFSASNGYAENPIMYINPTTTGQSPVWKHIYIDLTEILAATPDAIQNNFYITTQNTDGSNPGLVFFDNFRVIYSN